MEKFGSKVVESGRYILQLLRSRRADSSGYDTLYAAYGLMEMITGRPFMNNYGYSPTMLEGANRFQFQMYRILFGVADLSPSTPSVIGEIGCGQGWGIRHLLEHKFVNMIDYLGVDESEVATRYCQRHSKLFPQLQFSCSKGALPFEDNQFDYFFSVETSLPKDTVFMKRLIDCLKPGGRFVFYETYSAEEMAAEEDRLHAYGLRVAYSADITDHVVAALIEDNLEKVSLSARAFFVPYRMKQKLFSFVALPGTRRFNRYYRRERLCRIFVLEKPGK